MIFSNTEIYYASPKNVIDNHIFLDESESFHISKVMRHKLDDDLLITDGVGNTYKCKIIEINEKAVKLSINDKHFRLNRFTNISFYIPILKSSDRIDFAIEKCVELGITNFVIYSGANSPKRGSKITRWEKIGIAAMKQSLQSYKPNITFTDSLILENNSFSIIFDQLAETRFISYIKEMDQNKPYNVIIGPEAGFSKSELEKIESKTSVSLSKDRLRTETAAISAANALNLIMCK